jgi:hypothetical protein
VRREAASKAVADETAVSFEPYAERRITPLLLARGTCGAMLARALTLQRNAEALKITDSIARMCARLLY